MFDKIKQMAELKAIKDSLEKERIEVEKEGIRIIIKGNMEIDEIKLNPSLGKERQEEILKDCISEAVKKIQMIVAQKMMQMQ